MSPLAIPNQISTISMHILSLVKIHLYSLKLLSGNENTYEQTDGWTTDRHETIIPHHYRVAVIKMKRKRVYENVVWSKLWTGQCPNYKAQVNWLFFFFFIKKKKKRKKKNTRFLFLQKIMGTQKHAWRLFWILTTYMKKMDQITKLCLFLGMSLLSHLQSDKCFVIGQDQNAWLCRLIIGISYLLMPWRPCFT